MPGVTVLAGVWAQPASGKAIALCAKKAIGLWVRVVSPLTEAHPTMFEDGPALLDGTRGCSWPARVPRRPRTVGVEGRGLCRRLRCRRSRVEREIRALRPSAPQVSLAEFMLKPEAWAVRKHEDASRICNAAT